MSTRRFQADKPYFPSGGVNFDANAINIAETQCAYIENLRVLPFQLQSRDGSKKIAPNIPSNDPILHIDSFKQPNAEEAVFAFSKSGIFRLNQTQKNWTYALENSVIDDMEDPDFPTWQANWTGTLDNWGGSPDTTAPLYGTYDSNIFGDVANSTSQTLWKRSNLTVDTTGYTAIGFWFIMHAPIGFSTSDENYSQPLNVQLKLWDGATLKATINGSVMMLVI